MNDFGTGLIIGIFIGDILGVALMSLLALARDPEPPKHEPEHKEPAILSILWTVGNLCKWGDEVHEIRFFRQDKDGQTLACIFLDGATTGICVPIEELEVMEE